MVSFQRQMTNDSFPRLSVPERALFCLSFVMKMSLASSTLEPKSVNTKSKPSFTGFW